MTKVPALTATRAVTLDPPQQVLAANARMEGVEDTRALDVLKAVVYPSARGYLFCEPKPPVAIASWLRASQG